MNAFGRRLRDLMKENNMTQDELAKRLHISYNSVARIINGHRYLSDIVDSNGNSRADEWIGSISLKLFSYLGIDQSIEKYQIQLL